MDRDTIQRHLAVVEGRIAQGMKHIAQQRAFIADLEFAGQDSRYARSLLKLFLDMQTLYEDHRENLIKELNKKPP